MNKVPFLKWYSVFNIEQCEGLPERMYQRPEAGTENNYAEVETFIASISANVEHGGDCACFIPSFDLIRLPNPFAFESSEHYWVTSLHEHGHWSGHGSRLNRDLSGRFGEARMPPRNLWQNSLRPSYVPRLKSLGGFSTPTISVVGSSSLETTSAQSLPPPGKPRKPRIIYGPLRKRREPLSEKAQWEPTTAEDYVECLRDAHAQAGGVFLSPYLQFYCLR